MQRASSVVVGAFLALAACTTAGGSGSGSGGQASAGFEPTGGIIVASGNGARFNSNEVYGPKVQLKQRSDGTWGGRVYGSAGTPTPVDATFSNGMFVGSNIRLGISREAQQTTIVGSFNERIVRFECTPTEIRVRTGSRSETYVKLEGEGQYGGVQGLTMEGEAKQCPPTPSFALAMLGAFI